MIDTPCHVVGVIGRPHHQRAEAVVDAEEGCDASLENGCPGGQRIKYEGFHKCGYPKLDGL